MRYASRIPTFTASEYFPNGVKWLLISNIALFVLYFLAVRSGLGYVFYPFGLVPASVLGSFSIWQLFTYLFLHDPNGFGHILFNMLTLYMFGADLERQWGRRAFLKFYFICGVGAGLCVVAANALFGGAGGMNSRTIGASGAIYGLLLAFGVLYPDRTVLFSFLFPIKAKYFVMIIGAISFLSSVGASESSISHFAHLGGMIFGYLYLKGYGFKWNLTPGLKRAWHHYRLRRAKKKFQVYLRKNNSDRDRFVH